MKKEWTDRFTNGAAVYFSFQEITQKDLEKKGDMLIPFGS